MLITHCKFGWVRSLRRRKRRVRMWTAFVAEATERVKKERTVLVSNDQVRTLKELRCPGCGRKLAEPNRDGIIAGKIKCRHCKQTTEVL